MTVWRRRAAESAAATRPPGQRIIAVLDPGGDLANRVAALYPDDEIRDVNHVDDALKLVAAGATCILVLLARDPEDESFRAIIRQRGRSVIASVVVSDRPTAALLRQAMRSGAVDVVRLSAPDAELEDAIEQAWSQTVPVGVAEQHEGRITAVFSPKGGAGCTTLAVRMALTAAATMRCALVDTDMPFSDIAVLMGVEPRTSVADLTGADLDVERLTSALSPHSSGVSVLAGPPDPARAEVVTAQTISRVLELARTVVDLVIVDTASAFDDVTLAVLEAADDILLLTTADLASVKNAKVAQATFRLLGIPDERVHLVLNRIAGKGTLGVADIETQLGPAMAVIPEDVVFGRAGAMGVLGDAELPRNPVMRPLSHLLQRISSGGN